MRTHIPKISFVQLTYFYKKNSTVQNIEYFGHQKLIAHKEMIHLAES